MKAVEAVATVTPDHRLNVQAEAPTDVPPGEHRVMVLMDDAQIHAERSTGDGWPVHDADLTPSDASLRREDLYGSDGR